MSPIPARVFPGPQELAQAVVKEFIATVNEAQTKRGRCIIALAGGSTPSRVYELLATKTYQEQINWQQVHLLLGDERMVAPNAPEANQLNIHHKLLRFIPKTNVVFPDIKEFRQLTTVLGDMHHDEATQVIAHNYQKQLRILFNNDEPEIDLILLGIGEDGHTASIFPHSPEATHPSDHLIIPVVDSPKPPSHRVSFSLKLINKAKKVCILASGESKAKIVKDIFSYPPRPKELPIQQVIPDSGDLIWFMDQAASHLL